jgi:CheY-like chemotaxis protein
MVYFWIFNQKHKEMRNTVLVIDDSLPIRYLLEAMLSKKYSVVSAQDGLAAMAWISKGNIPDLIITDLQMPNIDGWELIKYLSESNLYRNIPVVVLSGIDNIGMPDGNVKSVFKKPFDPKELMNVVEEVFTQNLAIVYS